MELHFPHPFTIIKECFIFTAKNCLGTRLSKLVEEGLRTMTILTGSDSFFSWELRRMKKLSQTANVVTPTYGILVPACWQNGLKIVARPFVMMWANTDIFSQPLPRPYDFSTTEKILQIILTFKI